MDLKESFMDDKARSEVLFFKVLDVKTLTVSYARADNPDPEFCTFMRDLPVQIRVITAGACVRLLWMLIYFFDNR